MAQQINDPGFGVKVGRVRGRIVNPDGSPNVRRFGDHFNTADIYHYLLTARWWAFVLMVLAAYTVVNMLFAALYLTIGTDQLTNVRTQSTREQFESAFLFSAQTLTTVGYGNLAPRTTLVGAIAAFEALIGLLIFGIFTGVTYGRFARIKARITFSNDAVVAPLRSERNAFMVRLVNERSSVIMDAQANLLLALTDHTQEKAGRRFYQLPLEVSKINSLALNWTLVHAINTDSPLYGLSEADLKKSHAEFLVTITAFDDSVGQSFYSRTSYTADQVRWGRRFEPMFWTNEEGDVELHINKVHDHIEANLVDATEPSPLPQDPGPSAKTPSPLPTSDHI